MNDLRMWMQAMLVMTGDDSKPWLIAVCLIVSIVMMLFLFLLGRKDDDNHKNQP